MIRLSSELHIQQDIKADRSYGAESVDRRWRKGTAVSGGEAMFRPPSLHLQISLGKELSSFTGGGGGGAQNLLPSVPSSVPTLPLRRPGHDEADASDRRSRERQGKVALSLPPLLPAGLIPDGVTALASPPASRSLLSANGAKR